ncbi:MAG TPA: Xaa-Pro peptidase family protein [Phycisphaerae bacterium]|nr:Xaa-Pro peptidase family protein [Phycisphaerae bacterium]
MTALPKAEFQQRIERIQEAMKREKIDALIVYGDEYRKENLRYVCNFWPIFERGACFIPRRGEPILAGAPEGEVYAREMCVWKDLRNVKEFACVTVPEEIDYPMATFSSFREILGETLGSGKRLGLVGQWDIPAPILERLRQAAKDAAIVDAAKILTDLRLIKTAPEIACLRKAGEIACLGYERLMAACVPGATELQAAAAGEGGARAAGAENIPFMVFGSGPRVATIIGRPTERVIRDGDMVMAAMAVQYQGYVCTVEFPFVAGKASDGQKRFLSALFDAANVQLRYLRDGVIAGEMVRAVQDVFRKRGLAKYDIYPPMHGIGLAEAESPYPDEKADYPLRSGMCVNSDISLFGHPDGSNRIEEGFIITQGGPESLTPLIRKLCEKAV